MLQAGSPTLPRNTACGSLASDPLLPSISATISSPPKPQSNCAVVSFWRQATLDQRTGATPTAAPARNLNERGSGDELVWEALHLIHIFTFDTDQAGCPVASRRMQIALVIEISHARGQRIFLDRTRLSRRAFARARHRLVVGHHGLTAGLAIDRP